MEKLDKIIRYLDGEVTGEEKQLLEKEIASNEELNGTLNLIKEVDGIIQDTELVKFVNTIEEIKNNQTNNAKFFQLNGYSGNKKIYLSKTFLVAASISIFIVIASLLYYTTAPSNAKLYSQFYNKYEAYYVTRGDTNADTDELIVAIQLYDKKQYKEAISKFNAIIRNNNENTVAHFFIGISYMETNAFDKAIENLNTVIEQKDTAFMEHAQWYLALCYLKINKSNQAKLLIKQIASGESYYRTLATNLSRKLK